MRSLKQNINYYFKLEDSRSTYWHRIRVTVVSIFLVIIGNGVFGVLHFLTEPKIYGGIYSYFVVVINLIPLMLIYYRYYYLGKLIATMLYIINTFLFTYILYAPTLWNYLFFMLVPPFANMIFEINQRATKWVLSLIAVCLMLFCAFYPNTQYVIEISQNDEIITNAFILLCLVIVISASIAVILSDLEYSERRLVVLATTDSLTGLYNRHAFDEKVSRFHQQEGHYKSCYSFIFIDVNKFKIINDTYGHRAGDQVLVEIANVLKTNLRENDIATRFGGDEFILFLPFTKAADASLVAKRVTAAVRDVVSKICGFDVSISTGVAEGTLDEKDKSIIDHVISKADKALYEAKAKGKDVVML